MTTPWPCASADIIHTSWHTTDTYRRVVHLTYDSGSTEAAAPTGEERAEWLQYLLRDGLREPLPVGVNQNYAEQPLSIGTGEKQPAAHDQNAGTSSAGAPARL